METLGQFIRRKRDELALSQSELAGRLAHVWPGITRSEISKLESDQRELFIVYAERIKLLAAALEIDADELLKYATAPPKQR